MLKDQIPLYTNKREEGAEDVANKLCSFENQNRLSNDLLNYSGVITTLADVLYWL